MKPLRVLLTLPLFVITLSSCTSSGSTTHVVKRSTHPMSASTGGSKGKYLERRYFHPPGSKSGLAWEDIYAKP